MTMYAGETVRIKCVATSFDGVALTDEEITLAEVAIFDSAGEEVTQHDLNWDGTLAYWFYDWPTTEAGTFRLKALFHGAAFETWEYAKLRIKADPLDQG